jgi:hypothetical protein
MRKTSFCMKAYVEIHMQGPFFDIEKGIWKILVLKIQMVCTCFDGGVSKFLKLIVFWQIWADFAALAMAESMPKLRLKS